MINRKITEEKNPNFLGKLIFRYLPYWPLFAVLFIVFISGAWAYLQYATPLYETNARVLIKDEKKGAEESKTVESLDALSSKKIIENEIEVIQSRTLIDQVVKKLYLYAPVFEEKTFKSVSAYATSPVKIEAADVNRIRPVKKVYFSVNNGKIIIDGSSYPLNQFVSTKYGKLKFIADDSDQNNNNSKLYFSIVTPKSAGGTIQTRLVVTATSKQSTILNITYTDDVPERGEDIVNELLTVYNDASIQDKNTLAANTQYFIEERLKNVEHDLDSVEHKIQRYRALNGAVDISTQGKLFLENVSTNDQKLSEINMQLAVLDQVNSYVQSKDNSGGIVPSTLGLTDPSLSGLVEKLYGLELEYESQKKTLGANNPVLISVTDQIERIKPGILENIQSQRNGLVASRKNLSATNNNYSSVLQAIPEKEREMIEINREQGIKNQIYTFLLQKREETALSHASTVSDNKVVDKAQSGDTPVSPKSKVVYLFSILLASFAGIGIILGKETLSRKIMFRHEIEELTEEQVIGELIAESSKNPIVMGNNTRTLIAEQFRKIRATLNYMGVNSIKSKRILITSSIAGEGKSFVATNLALSLAMTGKKVILLDFDLNNPSLNDKLNIDDTKGITEYLSGECELQDIIRKTDLHQNLFLLPTGELPENPSELIMNGKVEVLLNTLDATFDYLVIDSAPVGPVTDAYILSSFSDITLYIIRHGYTPKAFIERLDVNNKINRLNNIAIVFNGVTPRGFGNNYGYGYGYGYTYGKNESPKHLPVSKN